MSQFPKRGLDLVLGQAHHRCASYPAQGIGENAVFSYGKPARVRALWAAERPPGRIWGEPPCGLDCRSAWPSEGGGHKPAKAAELLMAHKGRSDGAFDLLRCKRGVSDAPSTAR